MNRHWFFVGCCFLTAIAFAAGWVGPGHSLARAVDFEDLSLGAQSFYNGSDGAEGFTSGGASFTNQYDSQYSSWIGWSYSSMTNRQTPGYVNQYSAYPGGGGGGSSTYGVAFLGAALPAGYSFGENVARIYLPAGKEPVSMQVANTTYAALSMKNGDPFAKKFGGASGTDPDFFQLTIIGLDINDDPVASEGFTLADYTFDDSEQDYIREGWSTIDLSDFQGVGVVAIEFGLESSDTGPYGMNTPGYFAMDNLVLGTTPPPEHPLTTDLNHDHVVSRGDMGSLLSHYGSNSSGSLTLADVSLDGKVGLADLAMIQSDFGRSMIGSSGAGSPGPVAVPEPAGLLTLAIGLAALCGSGGGGGEWGGGGGGGRGGGGRITTTPPRLGSGLLGPNERSSTARPCFSGTFFVAFVDGIALSRRRWPRVN